jgi:hypothetical protein
MGTELGEWIPASLGIIAVMGVAGVVVVSIGVYVVLKVLRGDHRRRLG